MKSYKQSLSKDNIAEKSNALILFSKSGITPTQLDFFYLYLSKINARKPETREVLFTIDEYKSVMGIKETHTKQLQESISGLLQLTSSAPIVDGKRRGKSFFQLFSLFKVYKDEESGDEYVTANCHDEALPLMFELKEYTKIEVGNVLRLKNSTTHKMMYIALKEYEKAKIRDLDVSELKNLLLINKKKYPAWYDFKRYVLESSQSALAQHTDIIFTWEPIKKRHKTPIKIRLYISKNPNHIDQATIDGYASGIEDELREESDRFIETQKELHERATPEAIEVEYEEVGEESPFEYYRDAFRGEFSLEEVEELYRHALPYIQSENPNSSSGELKLKMYDYFMLKYSELNAYKKKVGSRIGLLKWFVKNDAQGGLENENNS